MNTQKGLRVPTIFNSNRTGLLEISKKVKELAAACKKGAISQVIQYAYSRVFHRIHVPGIKIVYPATPYDMKGLLNSALTGTDPVIVFES